MKFSVIDNTKEYCDQLSLLKNKYMSYLNIKKYRMSESLHVNTIDINNGSIALDNKKNVIAWVGVNEISDDLWGNYLLFSALYDIETIDKNLILKVLYGAEIEKIEKRNYEHKVFCSAFDKKQIITWLELGFGFEQAYGYANLNEIKPPLGSLTNIKVVKVNSSNNEDFIKFYSLIADEQAKAPVFAGAPEVYLKELKRGFEELVNDRKAIKLLAYFDDEAVGYQVWLPVNDQIIELSVSGTLFEERCKGIGTALTSYGVNLAIMNGYVGCITDWRTGNPYSSNFWLSRGFDSYRFRLVRRLKKSDVDDSERLKV